MSLYCVQVTVCRVSHTYGGTLLYVVNWEKCIWFVSLTRFLAVNKDESKRGLTVHKLKLNGEVEEAFAL